MSLNLILWIVQAILAALFLMAGVMAGGSWYSLPANRFVQKAPAISHE